MPTEIDGTPLESPMHAVAFTYPFNLSGHPAATTRAGFSRAGLPVGLQIVAERHRDDLVLQSAAAFEKVCPMDSWPL
jgi:aspartyl-tRNA(Asn)/glutamyl-tRNA(Gln) amidotransferase subunit A